MKKVYMLLLIALAIFIVGCEGSKTDDQSTSSPDSNGQAGITAAPGPTVDPNPPKNLMDMVARNPLIFTDKDLEFLQIRLWDSEQKLYEALGDPIGREDVYEDQFTWPVYYLEFEDFGFVRMEPSRETDSGDAESVEYIVGSVTVISDKYVGPRGIRVGDNYLDVVNNFFIDEYMQDDIIDGVMYLYAYPEGTMFISGRFIFNEETGDYNEEDIMFIMYNFTPFGEKDEFLGIGYTLAFTLEDCQIVSIGMKKQSTDMTY